MQYHRSLCYQLFGALLQWPPTTKFTNLNYGANRNVASNVVFANGSQDPWKRAGKYLHQDHFAGQHLLVVGCQNCGRMILFCNGNELFRLCGFAWMSLITKCHERQ